MIIISVIMYSYFILLHKYLWVARLSEKTHFYAVKCIYIEFR
jgi:hypothetical protein